MDKNDNPLKNAPHTQAELMTTEWNHKYSREQVFLPAFVLSESNINIRWLFAVLMRLINKALPFCLNSSKFKPESTILKSTRVSRLPQKKHYPPFLEKCHDLLVLLHILQRSYEFKTNTDTENVFPRRLPTLFPA
jgi:hypothetical protein